MYVPTYVLVQFFSVFIYIKHYTLSTFCIEQVPLEPIEVRRTLDYTPVFKPHIIEVFIAGER